MDARLRLPTKWALTFLVLGVALTFAKSAAGRADTLLGDFIGDLGGVFAGVLFAGAGLSAVNGWLAKPHWVRRTHPAAHDQMRQVINELAGLGECCLKLVDPRDMPHANIRLVAFNLPVDELTDRGFEFYKAALDNTQNRNDEDQAAADAFIVAARTHGDEFASRGRRCADLLGKLAEKRPDHGDVLHNSAAHLREATDWVAELAARESDTLGKERLLQSLHNAVGFVVMYWLQGCVNALGVVFADERRILGNAAYAIYPAVESVAKPPETDTAKALHG
jgi:hypothetical protein